MAIFRLKLSALALLAIPVFAFQRPFPPRRNAQVSGYFVKGKWRGASGLLMAAGDYSVSLLKPLGIVLEEREENGDGGGLLVKSIVGGGAAAASGKIGVRDILLKIGDTDITAASYDTIMDSLINSPEKEQISLTFGDGLGTMNITPNLAKQLKPDEAVLADALVRSAVSEIRRNARARGSLGDLMSVEIVLGAGVRKDGTCMVRFFAIFSTDGVTSYSCNVSATGSRDTNENIVISSLSCAKDEGWGQTVDLITEKK
eukprot:CAMPEP_0113551860 /NCGR_PEP_ID=MMETSP0015_2-20120614/14749_1 /TAXON_ID=2838 /ORGANISM="Odontella" /LENGTH=257 /DNA_ID=CAMNT_0000452779 /DNA_START=145 /DNA_END=918 /DNA_ORIENTATION=+ /assembly_acc=CAM_ASM_000160